MAFHFYLIHLRHEYLLTRTYPITKVEFKDLNDSKQFGLILSTHFALSCKIIIKNIISKLNTKIFIFIIFYKKIIFNSF